jgi:hypothetical protein
MLMLNPQREIVTFLPGLSPEDPWARWWLRQATVRLRREVCWLWHERAGQAGEPDRLPPFTDRLSAALDLTRYCEVKQRFFESDATARYLTDRLLEDSPARTECVRGSFGWVLESLRLEDSACFTLALGLLSSFDSVSGTVISSCLNDSGRRHPNLALVQRLWDRPEEILPLAAPAHPLLRYGLIQKLNGESGIEWEEPFSVLPAVAQQLLYPASALPEGLDPVPAQPEELPSAGGRYVAGRILAERARGLRVVPIRGPQGSERRSTAAVVGHALGAEMVILSGASAAGGRAHVRSLATLCWLRGLNLLIEMEREAEGSSPLTDLTSPASIPITLFVTTDEKVALKGVPAESLLPPLNVGKLGYQERMALWKACLGPSGDGLAPAIAECARRFRCERAAVRAVAGGLVALGRPLKPSDFYEACRAELLTDVGDLAQPVTPRFGADELVLPPKQARQFDEICRAMSALTEVHYGWGTARMWNESGIAALFAGPPGTGKTMAAEVLAARLDLPMYRIDLSQVVNKYIGETEKNLKRVFDAADRSDTLLFFDEADALFGRRTEVKDAHDRYANLEISYLLERMERFKGLAILASNRKKDLDEAFLRRLRFVIDFPLPEAPERRRIWTQAIPGGVDASALDLDFLAKQFQLAGAHIRSVIFNACLQSAGGAGEKRLSMEQVLMCVKRELEKLNRPVSLDQFGVYGRFVDG